MLEKSSLNAFLMFLRVCINKFCDATLLFIEQICVGVLPMVFGRRKTTNNNKCLYRGCIKTLSCIVTSTLCFEMSNKVETKFFRGRRKQMFLCEGWKRSHYFASPGISWWSVVLRTWGRNMNFLQILTVYFVKNLWDLVNMYVYPWPFSKTKTNFVLYTQRPFDFTLTLERRKRLLHKLKIFR